jgi:ATP-dependent DNA helicase DinG
MACLIAESINDSRHLVVEAPTGCGKSLAYLAPAVFWSLKNNNEPTVIATYTNALQDQLSESDFEILRQAFSADIKIAIAKGREHYTCLRRFKKYIEEAFEDNQDLPLEPGCFSRKLSAVFLAN